MKKSIYVLLVLLISTCSFSVPDASEDQMNYVRSAIVCDSKTNRYDIINHLELAEFFDNNDIKSVAVKYEYEKTKGVILKRVIVIAKRNMGGDYYYIAGFDRYAFPMSDCKKIKTELKTFK